MDQSIDYITDQCVSFHVLCTSVSLESGDQAAAVLLQLQDGHLARLVPYEGVSGLYIKPGIRLGSRKKKLGPAEKLMMHSFSISICSWTKTHTKQINSNSDFKAKTELHRKPNLDGWLVALSQLTESVIFQPG